MALTNLSVPSISISLAIADDPAPEPFSPFDAQTTFPVCPPDDSYRPSLLSPPPVVSPRFHRQPSPLGPAHTLPAGKGLDRSSFETLLASTKERNAYAKRAPNLRKELALKAHKSKQMERRALFLSKVSAPPSPTATGLPKTPPESPSIFHYSLPSPGLVSPLALFESLQESETIGSIQFPSVQPWVEQVEYRRGANSRAPSLEQITAHLSSQKHSAAAKEDRRRPIPLPTFLRASSRMKSTPEPLVGLSDNTAEAEITLSLPEEIHAPVPKAAGFPNSSQEPELEVITRLVPRSSSSSPAELTERNLTALNSRTLTSRDMMSKLKRRTVGLSADGPSGCTVDEGERRLRRFSAPAELPKRKRDGFAHPVLALPGAF
ncbi:hypothetical protein EDB92DRAFT_2112263 [Lactarius akahatsu]|uniref:Uncharacterized protein n=1 Tax=Lactarius akahatsu TaxID=416441 RepID=A0AAD4QGK1_9AGAM|nr:hypothetical protein EDB92DRAFT_2112263 [Lactarius akahatsu]